MNITRTIILILGIVVAVLLTLNSGLVGEVPTLTSGLPQLFADAQIEDHNEPGRIEQVKSAMIAGKNLYQYAVEIFY